ncbi:DinB superfamily protein [Tessaracoccus oleiagri]|uniref:DinB superfamily protein n=1 Tax=Tessaracoccus oleiagri TaxID=686624 RepID=A0A1G9L0M4_9ACTN|nr:DinB superfamily protein [Tessaracoccus oleiagri]
MRWGPKLVEQLEWHWDHQLRRRLDGLTDEEYFWEPVPGWSVRPVGSSSARQDPGYLQVGAGDHLIDFAFPEPSPPPVTTIAWRLGHILVGVLGMRIASHFDGPPVDYRTYDYPGSADEALRSLDAMHDQWVAGVSSWTDEDLEVPVGDREPGFGEEPRATLVLHIHRELIHHGAEIALLRDLYPGLRR